MDITITRYKRSELETAVEEKLKQGWEIVGNGIADIRSEKKEWGYQGNGRYGFTGIIESQKHMVKMRKVDKPAQVG